MKTKAMLTITLLVGIIASPGAVAEYAQGDRILLAELIVDTDKAAPRPFQDTANRQRTKAAIYSNDPPILEDESIGILQPRGGSPAEERAYENRSRARANQQSGDGAATPYTPGSTIFEPGNGPKSTEQRNKARAYTSTGNGHDIDLSNVGRDGLPIVPCQRVDNVSGRIGDDTVSGSIVFLIRNQQQIKVRCR